MQTQQIQEVEFNWLTVLQALKEFDRISEEQFADPVPVVNYAHYCPG
jgi:hypothetical protein